MKAQPSNMYGAECEFIRFLKGSSVRFPHLNPALTISWGMQETFALSGDERIISLGTQNEDNTYKRGSLNDEN
jgi:hypothetical protein